MSKIFECIAECDSLYGVICVFFSCLCIVLCIFIISKYDEVVAEISKDKKKIEMHKNNKTITKHR